MAAQYTFRAVIEDAGSGGAFVTIPFDVEQTFGQKRVKVLATIAGVPYRGSLLRRPSSPGSPIPTKKSMSSGSKKPNAPKPANLALPRPLRC